MKIINTSYEIAEMYEISIRDDDRDKLQEMSVAKHDQSYSETECKRETRERP